MIALLHVPVLSMVLTGSALHEIITACAANVGPITMRAIIAVESGGDPLAIDDDTTHRSYRPQTRAAAVAIAKDLLERGHSFDAGIAQVNSTNFSSEGLGLNNMFDPCTNVQAGSRILGRSYAAASTFLWIGHQPQTPAEAQLQEQLALRHAFSIYNSGTAWKSMRYADLVVNAGRRELVYRPPSLPVPGLRMLPSDMLATPTETMLTTAAGTAQPVETKPNKRKRHVRSADELAKKSELYPQKLSMQ